jgi:hypothetical protein
MAASKGILRAERVSANLLLRVFVPDRARSQAPHLSCLDAEIIPPLISIPAGVTRCGDGARFMAVQAP